jgi:hypothetical protein
MNRILSCKEDGKIQDYYCVVGVSAEHLWKVTEPGKTKYMDKNFSKCYFFKNKSHAVLPGIEPDLEDIFLACERLHYTINSTNIVYRTYVSTKLMTAYGLSNKLLEATTQNMTLPTHPVK